LIETDREGSLNEILVTVRAVLHISKNENLVGLFCMLV